MKTEIGSLALLSIVFVGVLLLKPSSALADYIMTIDTTPLANDSSDARLAVFARWDPTSGPSPVIEGMNLVAAIGNTNAVQANTPAFVGFLHSSTSAGDTVWAGGGYLPIGSAPEEGNVFRASNVGVLSLAKGSGHSFSTVTPQLVVEFRIDTTEVFDKQFAFTIGPLDGASSYFSDNDMQYAAIFSGTFDVGTVSTVPEPASLALLLAAVPATVLRRRRRAHFRETSG